MVFGEKLVELPVVKATEFQRQTAQRPNQRELRGDDVNDEAEPHLPGEREAMFGFALHRRQRLAGEEQIRVQIIAREGCRRDVSDPVRHLERAMQQITASPYVLHPADGENRKGKRGPRLEAL